MSLSRSLQVILLFPLLALAGCSGASGVTMTGTATLDGKPLDNATLEFAPLDKGQGGEVTMTDAQGNFKILPDKRKKGLVPGTKYSVRVSRWVDKKTKAPPPAEEVEQLRMGGFLDNTVPFRYWDPESNPPIVIDVKPGKNEGVQITLKSE